MPSHLFRHALVLGLLTAVGPFAIDMYLPALPEIGRTFAASPETVQASLMAFFAALGAGQLVSGPLSDIHGRRRPLFAGLAIFLAGSIGCALAPTIATLIGFRLLQGVGACAVMVIPRAVVRDLHTGPQAARLMSLLLTVYSVSPILAPLAGSLITQATGWRGVFWALAIAAVLGAVMVALLLGETRPPAARRASSFGAAMKGYRTLLADRRFVGIALIASLTLAGFFIYVANSSFVLTAHFGVSPQRYAMLFGLNAVSFVVASQFNGRLAARFGLPRVVRAAVLAHLATTLALLGLILAGIDALVPFVALLFLAFGLNGIIVPSTFVLAMDEHPALAGTASALIGTLNFAGGAAVVALAAPFADGMPLPMVAAITLCSAIVCALGFATLQPRGAAIAGANRT